MKKILSLILCLAVVLGCVSVALASGDTSIVKYEQSTSYTLSIPETITLNDMGESNNNDYSVAVTNAVLQPGANVGVSIDYDGVVATTTSDELTYSIYSVDGERVNSGSQILTVEAGNPDETYVYQFGAAATEEPKVAGHYEGTVVFVIDDQEYTMEEIEADDHLYAMGKTSPEYVVAKYNEDYTHVDIIKNGATSDGLMADFYAHYANTTMQKSPVSDYNPHYATVESITIHPGVKNVGSGAFTSEALLSREIKNVKAVALDLGEVEELGVYSLLGAPIEELTIPSTVTTVKSGTLHFCQLLKTIVVESSPNNPDHVLTFDGGLLGGAEWVPADKIVFPEDNVKITFNSFFTNHWNFLKELYFPKTISLVDSVVPCDFQIQLDAITFDTEIIPDGFCFDAAETVIIGKNVREIGDRAFAFSGSANQQSPLTSLEIENGVQSIGSEAFANNVLLAEVYVPESVVEIGANAFDQGVTIKGESGSYAETWATQNGYTFIAE